MKKFKCKQCGNCCRELPIYPEDITISDKWLWKSVGRDDVVTYFKVSGGHIPCIYLKSIDNGKTICIINDIKPDCCKKFVFGDSHCLYNTTPEKRKKICDNLKIAIDNDTILKID